MAIKNSIYAIYIVIVPLLRRENIGELLFFFFVYT